MGQLYTHILASNHPHVIYCEIYGHRFTSLNCNSFDLTKSLFKFHDSTKLMLLGMRVCWELGEFQYTHIRLSAGKLSCKHTKLYGRGIACLYGHGLPVVIIYDIQHSELSPAG